VKKQLRCTWIEVNNEVHTFVVDDEDHPWDDWNSCRTVEIVRVNSCRTAEIIKS
jgi:hypothetical protein